ncbi:hypothetical protein D0Y83_00100 [Qipengyuania flava]|uniref:Uncharacterized protein n=1 Tax=Qipengyuania flava TaxID=192812 RepID=A0A5P6N7F7_9SPHN|nr:hypothetical protein D0Y83_00100 [Qipengyuania flava]
MIVVTSGLPIPGEPLESGRAANNCHVPNRHLCYFRPWRACRRSAFRPVADAGQLAGGLCR